MLIKEEIEKEGWVFDKDYLAPFVFQKGEHNLKFFPDDGYTIIRKYDMKELYVCFVGNIASLEEFKTVLRQVGI